MWRQFVHRGLIRGPVLTASAAVAVIATASGWPQRILAQDIIRYESPAAWQTDSLSWVRDVAPRNKVDDLLDVLPDTLFDVIVNYNRCIEDVDSMMLEAVGPSAIQMKLKYITSVAMTNVSRSELDTIASWAGVAFIEGQWGFSTQLNVSVQNIQVSAGFNSPSTVHDFDPALDGSGVNIAIIDSGVDDVLHDAFNSTPFVAGYDAVTQTFTNPDDDVGHGTHVASIALGQATANTSRGVAPAAGLIDVKVLDASTFCTTPGQWLRIVDGLQTVYDNRSVWGVDIVNMSLRQCDASGSVISDGLDAFSQLIDLAESMDIVVVAAAGNDGPFNVGMPTPAAATNAITVAASNDGNSANRALSVIATFSNRGERSNDGDMDFIDELKPEVTAPGDGITAARFNTVNQSLTLPGTSMAAPHVAGLAALIREARPDMTAGAVKDLIISTAEPRGPASAPAKDPVWNREWGWGLVNGFAAISTLSLTDLRFPSHPPNPIWLSPDLSTVPFPPQVNQAATVHAVIENAGPSFANDVRILFGIHDYSASTPTFFSIGTRIVDLPLGQTTVSMPWTPRTSGHQCLKVEIAYGQDTDFSDNKAQRNITVAQSPVYFQVRNTYTEAAAPIRFQTTLAIQDSGWQVFVTPDSLTLAAEDCPMDVEVLLVPPVEATPQDTNMVHVRAYIPTLFGDVTLGGVTVLKTGEAECPIVLPGDMNNSGTVTSADIITLVNFVFKSGTPPFPCVAAGDVNCSGTVTSADIILLVNFVFKGGSMPCDICVDSPLAASCN